MILKASFVAGWEPGISMRSLKRSAPSKRSPIARPASAVKPTPLAGNHRGDFNFV